MWLVQPDGCQLGAVTRANEPAIIDTCLAWVASNRSWRTARRGLRGEPTRATDEAEASDRGPITGRTLVHGLRFARLINPCRRTPPDELVPIA